ncbi:MAG: tetratricopeptide repeat protein [Elusimicrobiota bacterium]
MQKTYINVLLLVIVSILTFANTLRNPFMWDDAGLVELISQQDYQNHLKNPLFFLTPSYWKNYRKFHDVDAYVPVAPMRTLALSIDYRIWKWKPFGYHLTNLLFHTLNVLLVYFLVRILVSSLHYTLHITHYTAFFTALLFATHPMHTESVAWIKNRIDLITAVFYLSSLILFVKHTKQTRNLKRGTDAEQNTELTQNRPFLISKYLISNLYPLFSLFCFILALLSKEIAVTLPAVLVLYIICFVPQENKKKRIISTLPFWLLTFLYIYLAQFVVKPGLKLPLMAKIDLYSNILLVFKTLAWYLKLLVSPFSFNADRVITIPKLLFEPTSLISLFVVGGLGFAAVKVFNYSKELSFCLFWFFVTILPVLNIIYLAPRPLAEQRLYIPSIGFCFLLGKLFADGLLKKKNSEKKILLILSEVVLLLLIFAYSFATVMRNFDWRNEIVFWQKTAEKSPLSPRAKTNLAEAYIKQNEHDKAQQIFEDVLKNYPDYPPAHTGLGLLFFNSGDIEKAVKEFQKAGLVE